MSAHPRGGWLLARALKEKVHNVRCERTRPRAGWGLVWEELKSGMEVVMKQDKEAVRSTFNTWPEGATKGIDIGVLAEDGNLVPARDAGRRRRRRSLVLSPSSTLIWAGAAARQEAQHQEARRGLARDKDSAAQRLGLGLDPSVHRLCALLTAAAAEEG